MSWLGPIRRRVLALFSREQFHHDLEEEMRLHVDLRRKKLAADGLSPDLAQPAFGNSTLLRETSGDAWRWLALEHFLQDLRYGARGLVRTPGFTAVAVIALALGIGANTAIFSVVNSVLLNPLAYRDADRLVTILHNDFNPVAAANYLDWRDQTTSFEAMAAAEAWGSNLTGFDSPEHLVGIRLTPNLLPMLGIAPVLGRFFVSDEAREVVLTDHVWNRRFNRDPNILGRVLTLSGVAYTVVGVMPPDFHFAPFWITHAEIYAPLDLAPRAANRGGNSLRIFARLRPGVTLAQARSEVKTVTARLESQYPGTNRRVTVRPIKENVVGRVETPLLVLLAAVGFVLLIACANVAHMLLARTSDRQREIAVRTALGAGRMRVIRQFLTENLLLAALGASAGLLLAIWGVKVLVALSPANLPRVETIAIDGRVLFFIGIATILTAVVFGLPPAMQAAAANLGRTRSRNRLRTFLVASEFAMAFLLLVGAGLMIRSFIALMSVDPGFHPDHVLSMIVSVAGSGESEVGRREIFYRQLLDRVRALPGVESAGGINHLPLHGDIWGWPFTIEGRPKPRPGESPNAVYRIAMPGYFETMRLPVLRGRAITAADDSRAPGAVVINERAAARYWPGEDPLGKRIRFDQDWLTIVGIVKDAKQYTFADPPDPEVYLAALQNHAFLGVGDSHSSYITLVVRTAGDPASLAPIVKQTVWGFDRNLPISEVVTMEHVVSEVTAQQRFEVMLLGVFASIALLLAAVGIYGVMNYAVARRTQEIGIRISLGASRADVLRMVARQGIMQAATGMIFGAAGALVLARAMSTMLYGVRPNDPLTFVAVALVLGLSSVAAIWVPARKATRIQPMVALRCD